MKNRNLNISIFIVICLTFLAFTYLLHHASKKIEALEISKNNLKIELYKELNNIAWDSTITSNKQYVLNVTRYYDCNAVKTKIETYLNEQQ
jgi:hypothetical protein